MRALCFVGTLALVGMLALVGALLLAGLAATICVLTLGINGLLTTLLPDYIRALYLDASATRSSHAMLIN